MNPWFIIKQAKRAKNSPTEISQDRTCLNDDQYDDNDDDQDDDYRGPYDCDAPHSFWMDKLLNKWILSDYKIGTNELYQAFYTNKFDFWHPSFEDFIDFNSKVFYLGCIGRHLNTAEDLLNINMLKAHQDYHCNNN